MKVSLTSSPRDLSALSPSSEESPLRTDQLFDEALKICFFLKHSPDTLPTDKEIIQELKDAGLAMKTRGEEQPERYSEDRVIRIVRDKKAEFVKLFDEATDRIYKQLINGNTESFLAIVKLRKEIPSSAVFDESPTMSPAVLIQQLQKRLKLGERGSGISDERLTKDVSRCVLRSLFDDSKPNEALIAHMQKFAQRYVRLERWGMGKHLLSRTKPTPPTFTSARETFFEKRDELHPNKPADESTPWMVYDCARWLYQRVKMITGCNEMSTLAPVILKTLDLQLQNTGRQNWDDPVVRERFYEKLIADAKDQDPRNCSVNRIHDEAQGLCTYYARKFKFSGPSTQRLALVHLLEEFHPETLSPLHRDQILAKYDTASVHRLCLRYYDISQPRNYYTALVTQPGTTNSNWGFKKLGEVEDGLTAEFSQNDSNAHIADRRNIGRRGIQNIRAEYSTSHPPSVILSRRGSSTTTPSQSFTLRRDMLTVAELQDELQQMRQVRLLHGKLAKAKIAFEKLTFTPDLLREFTRNLTRLYTSDIDITNERSLNIPRELLETLFSQIQELKKIDQKTVAGRRNKNTPPTTVGIPNSTLEPIESLLTEIRDELHESHYRSPKTSNPNDSAGQSPLNTSV